MKCPNCDTTLLMTDRNGVEIDYCPDCRGVWLDRGELDKIIDRVANESEPRSESRNESRYEPRGYGGYEHKKRRKKSLLGELFDFD